MNIKLVNKISKNGLSLFSDDYVCAEDMQNADAMLVRSAKLHDEVFEKSVQCIARAGAGVNNIPLDRCAKEGIVVFNTPGANANAVKELVLGSMVLSARNMHKGIEWSSTLKGKGDEVEALVEKGKAQFVGPEISGKKIGVLGLGAIGVLVANACKSLGLEVYGYDPYISINAAWNLKKEVNYVADMKQIFAECDYITVHIPFNKDTKHTVNAEMLELMKPTATVMNFARGGLVDDDAIIEALNNGKIASYVTDFPNAKTIECDKIINIPHLGASTPESEENCAVMAVNQVADFLENGNIVNSVNYPDLSMPRGAKTRCCIAHENIPNVVGSVSSVLASEGINIESMANRSRGEYAYMMIDTNSDISADLVTKLEEQNGVIRVRVIV